MTKDVFCLDKHVFVTTKIILVAASANDRLRASLSGTFLKTARIGYVTDGALFISAQLSTDTVSALRKVWVLIRPWKQYGIQTRM